MGWVILGIAIGVLALVGFSCIKLSGDLSRLEEEEDGRDDA